MQIVFETHSTTLDNEAGIATGWLLGELSPRRDSTPPNSAPPGS